MSNINVEQSSMGIEQLLEKAIMVGKIAEEEAFQSEADETVSKRVVEAIKEAQIHRLLLPKKYGGPQIDYASYWKVIRTISKYNISAAWLANLFSSRNIWASYLPLKGRDEVLNQGGLLADVFTPVGKVTKDGDGYRLTGHYYFCSGILYSDWVALGANMEFPDSDGPETVLLVVPISEVKVVKNWNTFGLRGTGSNQVIVENVYVPEHRIARMDVANRTGKPPEEDYDRDYPFYNFPFMSSLHVGFTLMALGGTERLLEEFKKRTEKRVRARGDHAKESPRSQGVMAELTMKFYESEGLLDRYINMINNFDMHSDSSREEFAAIRGRVAKNCTDIAVKIFLTLGGFATFKGDPVELFTRDVLMVATHRTVSYEDSVENYGKALFGFETNSPG